ncbi:hypothetical protein [Anaerosalibacter sp. Marseille-P3206]|uniref:hypothetical protein n=1 Tax=Anaerosalibacter sp. Marseille-P3206 TaxID=1871005 RepID=UPI0009864F11|nr:hypothetical protein [Anaerosalibacter sp. Marseille-P3206]
MKKVFAFVSIVFVFLLIIFLSISNIKGKQLNSALIENNSNEFAIYKVLNEITDIQNCFLDTLLLEDEAIFTDKDLVSYDWTEHKLLIKSNKYIDELRKNHLSLSHKPFIVVVNGERIYMGVSWSFASSAIAPSVPTIDWSELFYKQNKNSHNTYTIQIINNDTHGDYRNDKRVYDVLKNLDKLK